MKRYCLGVFVRTRLAATWSHLFCYWEITFICHHVCVSTLFMEGDDSQLKTKPAITHG